MDGKIVGTYLFKVTVRQVEPGVSPKQEAPEPPTLEWMGDAIKEALDAEFENSGIEAVASITHAERTDT